MRPADQKHRSKTGSEMLERNAIRRETCGVPDSRSAPWLYTESINRACDAYFRRSGINPKFVY